MDRAVITNSLEAAPAGPAGLDELRELISRGDVTTVICGMPDLWGRLVGKRVTAETFLSTVIGEEGLHGSLYLFVVDMDMDPRPGYALTSWEDGFLDCRMVPDLSTLRVIPWLPNTALVICDPHHEDRDALVEVAPRVILRRQLERLREADMTLKCATELEFYLFRDTYEAAWDRRYRDLRPMSYYRSDYHILQSTKDDWFLERVRRHMNEAGLEVEFSKSEWGLGQQEINLRYCEALEMADRHMLYKNGVKEIAALNGLSASFMAKPAIDEVGSSCHVHASLWDGAGERPLLWGPRRGAPPQRHVPRLHRRPGRSRPRVRRPVRAQRQLLQALPGRELRRRLASVGSRQPHMRAARGRREIVAASRAPHPGRRRQPLSRTRGGRGRRASGH